MAERRKQSVNGMTTGVIWQQILFFFLPILVGSLLQQLYNTADAMVVGRFVGTAALSAVGGTTNTIINLIIGFFVGLSSGATVIISQYFGGGDLGEVRRSVHTALALCLVGGVALMAVGLAATPWLLRALSTPEDVMSFAVPYLRIFFLGTIPNLMFNIGSGILRAVGDTMRPLYFLVMTSVLNILLDLLFVLGFHCGIEGVAWATVLSQFISALLILALLTRSDDIYRLSWHDLRIDRAILGSIFAIGLPAGIQSVITAFSNVFVQSDINFFGSSCMAGWSCYNKLDQFVMLPMQSMSMAATTFVSQNIGAGREERANRGTVITVSMAVGVTAVIVALLCLFAAPAVGLFSPDESVIAYGVLFIRANCFFLLFNCVNHVLAGALRGRGDSRGPMIIMLLSFVGIRQIYLFAVTRFVANTPLLVGFGYPVGWTTCCIIEVTYFFLRWRRPARR